MRELSLHILDIAENGIRAGADRLLIHVEESSTDDRLTCPWKTMARDAEEKIRHIDDPFVTTAELAGSAWGFPCWLQRLAAARGHLRGSAHEKGTA